ncbi:uncharacterized protein PRCAT00002566001 [Priceomyces carsonii]|uniref:uncharacterized protein n=1 Tax=Priceomyces carsonii TaxID=28549 RepID=UPI002EDA6421|nr:unnamed protein product [Priceomyces carsonii]
MSLKFPSFSLQSIQDSLPTVDQVKESFSKVNAGKTVDHFKESIQPFANKTTLLISTQLQQLQHLADPDPNVEVSQLPADYLELEKNCDLLLNLYTDLIQFSNDTYAKVSYDYPPGNYALAKIRDSNVGGILGSKFHQLKNVSSPQELEKILVGGSEEENVNIQTTSAKIPKTLYGHLSLVAEKYSNELQATSSPLSLALLKLSSSYLEIASARLDMDKKITDNFAGELLNILNEQFIKVNELRKKVYSDRADFDNLRARYGEDEENENLIAKEDELVSATELAVSEMKKLLKPSKNVSLLKVFIDAQREWFEVSAKKLADLLKSIDAIEFNDEEDDDE